MSLGNFFERALIAAKNDVDQSFTEGIGHTPTCPTIALGLCQTITEVQVRLMAIKAGSRRTYLSEYRILLNVIPLRMTYQVAASVATAGR